MAWAPEKTSHRGTYKSRHSAFCASCMLAQEGRMLLGLHRQSQPLPRAGNIISPMMKIVSGGRSAGVYCASQV